jgi:hypothetical protein
MRSRVGQLVMVALLGACSARQPVLSPPAPAALPPAAGAPLEPAVEAARQAEEQVERVDVSPLLEIGGAGDVAETDSPSVHATFGRLEARVVDADGRAVADVEVVLHGLASGEERRARSGVNGAVVFLGLAAGDYLLRCAPEESVDVAAIPVRLGAGEAPPAIEIRLPARHPTGEIGRALSRPTVAA